MRGRPARYAMRRPPFTESHRTPRAGCPTGWDNRQRNRRLQRLAGVQMQVWPGQRYPLGATYDGMGTNFAIFSEVAQSVELCLFDDSDDGNEQRIRLHEVD